MTAGSVKREPLSFGKDNQSPESWFGGPIDNTSNTWLIWDRVKYTEKHIKIQNRKKMEKQKNLHDEGRYTLTHTVKETHRFFATSTVETSLRNQTIPASLKERVNFFRDIIHHSSAFWWKWGYKRWSSVYISSSPAHISQMRPSPYKAAWSSWKKTSSKLWII